jgi:hypothetical protein
MESCPDLHGKAPFVNFKPWRIFHLPKGAGYGFENAATNQPNGVDRV